MDNPLLVQMISELPLLLDNPDLVQRLLDLTHAGIDRNTVQADETAAQLEELRELQRALRENPMDTEEDIGSALEDVAAGFEALLQQQRRMNQVLELLIVVRAVAYARSRSRLVPGLLLAAASAAVAPGLSTFVRFSVVMLGFLFASHRPRRGE